MVVCRDLSFTGNQQKALGCRFLFEGCQASPSGSSFTRFHLDFSQREPGLELVADPMHFCQLRHDDFETLDGFGGFSLRGPDPRGDAALKKPRIGIITFLQEFARCVIGLLRLRALSLRKLRLSKQGASLGFSEGCSLCLELL